MAIPKRFSGRSEFRELPEFRKTGITAKSTILHMTNLYGPVVWVKQQFRQGHNLGRSVPAVRTMDQDGPLLWVYGIHNNESCAQQANHVLQPLGVVNCRQPAVGDEEYRLKQWPCLHLTEVPSAFASAVAGGSQVCKRDARFLTQAALQPVCRGCEWPGSSCGWCEC